MDLTPQQQLFKKYYTDPKSETFSNAYRSALKADYSDEYSKNITGQDVEWISEILRDQRLVQKAEKNLEMAMDGLLDDPEGGSKVIQYKATEFTLKGLQKGKWADRKELGGIDGKDLIPKQGDTEVINNALDNI